MKTSDNGIKLIQHFESCELEAYLDSVGIPTIGWGNTRYEDGRPVKLGDVVSQARADELFAAMLVKFEHKVLEKIKRPMLQHQFDAAVSFCYNAGTSYRTKTGQWQDFAIWKNIDKNMPADEIRPYWEKLAITGGGKVLKGLVRRRKAEAHLYTTGQVRFFE